MRILIIAFLFPVSVFAQTASFKFSDEGTSFAIRTYPQNLETKVVRNDCTAIAMSICPLSDSVSYRKVFLDHYKGKEKDFDCWSSQFKFSAGWCKYVEVRIKDDGLYKDMTFAEFKKLIWPNQEVK